MLYNNEFDKSFYTLITRYKQKSRSVKSGFYLTGSDLLSHRVAPKVPSAQKGLTSVFGMETGVSPSLSPPKTQ